MFGHIVKFCALRPLTGAHRRCGCVCACARLSPLTCPEASFPNLHGTVIAKFKQWSRGHLHHTIPADRAEWMGRVQRNQSFAYIATRIRTPSESGKELQASKARRGNQEKARQAREGRPRRGFDEHRFDVPVRGPTSQLEASRI